MRSRIKEQDDEWLSFHLSDLNKKLSNKEILFEFLSRGHFYRLKSLIPFNYVSGFEYVDHKTLIFSVCDERVITEERTPVERHISNMSLTKFTDFLEKNGNFTKIDYITQDLDYEEMIYGLVQLKLLDYICVRKDQEWVYKYRNTVLMTIRRNNKSFDSIANKKALDRFHELYDIHHSGVNSREAIEHVVHTIELDY